MHSQLTVIWAGIIVVAVAMYVVMDGFDLGIGILFTRFAVGEERDTAMNSIAPVWDGNETWLVLGGGGLMAAFPLAYAIILPALYAPMIAMLLGLVFRGVAFEFRWRDPAHRARWDAGFCLGSIVATFAQGVTLGALVQGIKISGRAYAGGYWDWGHSLQRIDRREPAGGLCLARRLLADVENLGTPARRGAPPRETLEPRAARGHRRGEPLHAISNHGYFDTWFTRPGVFALGLMPLVVAAIGAALYRCSARGATSSAVRPDAEPVRSVAAGPCHFHVALCHPGSIVDLGCSRAEEQSGVHAGRGGRADSVDPRLHLLGVLGVSRQGGARGISLSPESASPLYRRLLWMLAIWAAGVAAFGAGRVRDPAGDQTPLTPGTGRRARSGASRRIASRRTDGVAFERLAHAVDRAAPVADHGHVRVVYGQALGAAGSGQVLARGGHEHALPAERHDIAAHLHGVAVRDGNGPNVLRRSHCTSSGSTASTHTTARPSAIIPICTSRCRKCESKA